jgi:hypothetical protein
MKTQTISLESLHNRIANLERQNGRLKISGAVALACVAMVALMAQKPAPKTLEANNIIVKDSAGNTRVRIGVDPTTDAAEMWLQTAKADEGASLSESGLLLKENGAARTIIQNGNITLGNSKGQPNIKLSADDNAERALSIEGNSGNLFYLPGHALEIQDADGYETSIGNSDLRATAGAAAHSTNAASVILFDPDKKVIWKAP